MDDKSGNDWSLIWIIFWLPLVPSARRKHWTLLSTFLQVFVGFLIILNKSTHHLLSLLSYQTLWTRTWKCVVAELKTVFCVRNVPFHDDKQAQWDVWESEQCVRPHGCHSSTPRAPGCLPMSHTCTTCSHVRSFTSSDCQDVGSRLHSLQHHCSDRWLSWQLHLTGG